MTIGKGREWGEPIVCPVGLTTADSDDEAARVVDSWQAGGRPVVGLRGGDLFRTVGGVPGRLTPGAEVVCLPIDLLRVTLDDGDPVAAVAHVVARVPLFGSAALGWWRGDVLGVFNAQFLGAWDAAPRGHPNDGRVDVVSVSGSMTMTDRWMARRRLATGTHVPHPSISTRQVPRIVCDLPSGAQVWVDGRRVGAGQRLEVVVEPDAFQVVV